MNSVYVYNILLIKDLKNNNFFFKICRLTVNTYPQCVIISVKD